MRDAKQSIEPPSPTPAAAETQEPSVSLRAALGDLAELGRVALDAQVCVLGGQTPAGTSEAVAAEPAAQTLATAARVALAAMAERQSAHAVVGGAVEIARGITGFALGEGSIMVRVALAGGPARAAVKAQPILELVARAACAELRAADTAQSQRFWRDKAAAAMSRAGELAEAALHNDARIREIEGVAADAAALSGSCRYSSIGEAAARVLGCGKWLVAAPQGGALRIVAAAAKLSIPGEIEDTSAIAECARGGRTLVRIPGVAAPRKLPEDRILGSAWIVFPAGPAVVAVAGGEIDAPGFAARVETLGARLGPILRAWVAEDALSEYRATISRLALRMFAAVDDERARIARDLHDDQAQLLAAAQIALDGGGEQARNIFRNIAQDLRARTRELRPPSLERTTLVEALEAELERLKRQGIRAHLVRGKSAARIPAPIQRLCWQVAREALANVARHSGANSVEVELERGERFVRLSVRDNGRGFDSGAATGGGSMGITAIRERLALMGGTLKIDSSAEGTILCAEIPEPG